MNATRMGKDDNSFGVISANDAIKLANGNKRFNACTLPISSSPLMSSKGSRSKLLKRQAVHLIRFCLKSGITRNKDIVQYLKENEVVLKNRTFDRYKNLAEKVLENDLDADIWLSHKVQKASVHDYKDISDRYDRQLFLDDMFMQSLIMQAIDKAIKYDNDPDKYYRYLDISELMKIQAISNYTMKNKLELTSKGFLVYRIKQHIEYLREQLHQKQNKPEFKGRELDLSSLSFLPKSNTNPPAQESCHRINEPQNEEFDQDYLDRNDLAIGMAGKPIKKYLAEIEKKIGKPLSTI